MTRPSEVKPREGDLPGAKWEEFEVGAELPRFTFTVTPDIVKEYSDAIDCDLSQHRLDGRTVAVPSVLCVYLMAVLYRRYPPAQGGIMASNKFRYHSPIHADADTVVVASGRVIEKFEKRGRRYVRYTARFESEEAGRLIAEAENVSTFPN